MNDIGTKFPVGSGFAPPQPVARTATGGDSVDGQVRHLEDIAAKSKAQADSSAVVDGKLSLDKVGQLLQRFIPKDLPDTRLQIDHDKVTDMFIYKSIDAKSGEVVRQYPADEVLRFISYYREREGLLVDNRA